MKYKTLKALKAAYDDGVLKADTPMYLDNDDTFVSDVDGKRLFDGGNPEDLLVEALKLLGIPSEGV